MQSSNRLQYSTYENTRTVAAARFHSAGFKPST
jgi:hypothetical protein